MMKYIFEDCTFEYLNTQKKSDVIKPVVLSNQKQHFSNYAMILHKQRIYVHIPKNHYWIHSKREVEKSNPLEGFQYKCQFCFFDKVLPFTINNPEIKNMDNGMWIGWDIFEDKRKPVESIPINETVISYAKDWLYKTIRNE